MPSASYYTTTFEYVKVAVNTGQEGKGDILFLNPVASDESCASRCSICYLLLTIGNFFFVVLGGPFDGVYPLDSARGRL